MIRARLGQYLDASVAELVEFRGEGILVDSYFPDGGFRRKLSSGKAVDVNLAAVGAGRRPGERIELILQLIWIVGECIQVFALDHDRTGVVVGAGVESGVLIGHGDLLLVYGDDEGEVLQCGSACLNRYLLRLREIEAGGGHGDGVSTGNQLGKEICTIGATLHR